MVIPATVFPASSKKLRATYIANFIFETTNMTKKKWPLILVFVGSLIAIGTSIGIRQWNRAPEKVEDSKGITVTVTELCNKFSTDEAAANKQYLNKALQVTGTVGEVSQNQDGATVIILQGEDPAMGVQCTMRDKNVSVSSGKKITVKGFCSGNTMFDVLLTDCIVIE